MTHQNRMKKEKVPNRKESRASIATKSHDISFPEERVTNQTKVYGISDK
jgi:hypothetical protein